MQEVLHSPPIQVKKPRFNYPKNYSFLLCELLLIYPSESQDAFRFQQAICSFAQPYLKFYTFIF